MKRILYFYPHKFSGITDGIHMRIVTLLQYFKRRNILVDMIHYDHPGIDGSFLVNNELIANLYLVADNPFLGTKSREAKGIVEWLEQKMKGVRRRIDQLFNGNKMNKKASLPNLMTPSLIGQVDMLLTEKKYDAVLVTYSYWADIVKTINLRYPSIKKIIDPTDFLTLHQLYKNSELSFNEIGEIFGDEVERVNYFDDIIHISYDELLLFSNFLPKKKHHYIPQYFSTSRNRGGKETKYDITIIASANNFNVEGINWFFEKVYPFLSKGIRIAVAGNICKAVKLESDNITKLGFVDDVDEIYQLSHCTFCPLKRGSGMKIKVIEALSYGFPVVSTLKGIDGFINKDLEGGILVTDDPENFAGYLNRLVEDREYYDKQSDLSRKLFSKYFSMDANTDKLDQIFMPT
jgi:glycosyltransferase involved in cell wall biosynthesis